MDPSHDQLIAQFVEATGAETKDAEQYLTASNWDLQNAAAMHFASHEEGDAQSDEDMEQAPPEYTGPRTLDGRPAPESVSISAAPPSGRRQPARGGIATLGSLGGDSHAGHGHDDDESDDEQPRDLYAGGEKSGQYVQDPTNRDDDSTAKKLMDKIMKKAKEQAEREQQQASQAGPSSRFTGSGVTLGGDGHESTPVQSSAPAARPPRTEVAERTLHLWDNGFSVDDGPLYNKNDNVNDRYFEAIENNRVPHELLNVPNGQDVDLHVQKHDGDYVKPKTVYKPFGGSGHRLGSPVPGAETAAPASAAPSNLSQSGPSAEAPQPQIDPSQPIINLRIQLADGTRLPARFNTTQTVGDIYDFISLASPSSGGRQWLVATTFPNKDHTDKSLVLGEMAEFKRGGTAVQKWI